MMLWKTKVWRGQKQIQSLMSLNSERSATLLSTASALRSGGFGTPHLQLSTTVQ